MKMLVGTLFMCLSMMLVACSPRYATRYDFVSPDTPQGNACIQQCKHNKEVCSNHCAASGHGCGCQQDYEACYQLCGGRMVPHKVCVKFCDTREVDN